MGSGPLNFPTPVLWIITVVLWLSAAALFVVGFSSQELKMLMWLAIPDAVLATGATAVAISRSMNRN